MDFAIEWIDELDSTNNELVRRVELSGDGLVSGTLLAARMQTAGRGRQQRRWLADAGKNLLFSFFMQTNASLMDVPSLTMAVAMGIDDALQDLGVRSSLKWPNDVLVDDQKICGILSEGIAGVGVVVGIGLNVNMDLDALARVDRPATSVLVETGREHDLQVVLDLLLQNMPRWIARWETARFAGLRETYQQKCAAFNGEVTVRDGDSVQSGVLIGFGRCGEALLRLADGVERAVWAGDMQV